MTTISDKSSGGSRSNGSAQVRASRNGDRFHYTWAATSLLRLLSPTSELQQVTIEGLGSPVSEEEPEGSEVIDLVEFYGHSEREFSSLKVCQLKHSTSSPTPNLTLGDVGGILKKFARLDNSLRKLHPQASICFSIVTNRPIALAAHEAISELKMGGPVLEGSNAAKLREKIGVDDDTASKLCSKLELCDREAGVKALRSALNLEVSGLTADTDLRISASLVDLVAARASTESNGPINKADVLAAFGCREDELAPAPCMLDDAPFIARDAYRDLADKILEAAGSMIVTAEGGVGKSTFARALPDLLSDCADVIIYDCFGNGNYRNPAHPRHRHRDGFVQLATELAGLGLCLPIVPAGNLEPEEYTKAFVRRLDQASEMLNQRRNRQLVIVVDAADNAVIAAEDNAGSRSFVRDLLRLQGDIPPNVRVVLTCRPERLDSLKAPKNVASFELSAFTRAETRKVVLNFHSSATEADTSEIHDRTAGNPRVISTLLLETETIDEALSRISGIGSHQSALESLMQDQVAKAFENAGKSQVELERVAQLLTLLRPSVPLDVLANLAGTQIETVRSFIADLGRGLILEGQSVQFLDEPTETFFREQYPATQEVAAQIATQLRELSGSSAYAALSLPEVLWSAELYDELLDLVATDDALPETSDVKRTQVEHLRVEFGLRAAVQLQRSDSIVQLAMRAGAGRAGKDRQFTVIRDNPDLAGMWLDVRVLSELIASREFPESWPGSTLGSEAAMLAHTAGGVNAARSRARQAKSAIAAWVDVTRDHYSSEEEIKPEQVALIALAALRTDGPDSAAQYLSEWRPDSFVLESSAVLARMLISTANDEDVDEDVLGLIASSTYHALLLGILGEMQRVGLTLEVHHLQMVWSKLEQVPPILFADSSYNWNANDIAFRGVAWLCALAVRHQIAETKVVADRLHSYLPTSLPIGLGDAEGRSRSGLLFSVALYVKLMGEDLKIEHFRPTQVPAKRGTHDAMKSNDEELKRYLSPALDWLDAWANYACGELDPQSVAAVIKSYPKNHYHDKTWSMSNRIARQVLPLLGVASQEEAVTLVCNETIQAIAADDPIAGALDLIPRLRGNNRFEVAVLDLANAAREVLFNTAEPVESKVDTLVQIARGFYRFSSAEAQSYFDQAVKAAGGVGDDAIYRWDAIVALTRAAAGIDTIDAIPLAERVAHLGEMVEPISFHDVKHQELVAALALVSGPNVFRILGQWRDRRFGSLDLQFWGLVEEDDFLLAGRPNLAIILAPFSTKLNLNASLRYLDLSSDLNEKVLSTVNNLANRLGRSLDSEFVQSSLPDPPHTNGTEEVRWPPFDRTPEQQAKRDAQIEKCKEQIAELNLTQVSGVDEAVRLQREVRSASGSLLASEVFSRSMFSWGPILDAVLNSDSLDYYELVKFLNAALRQPRDSRSFEDSLTRAVDTFVKRYGARVIQHPEGSIDLRAAADLLGVSTIDLLQRAIDHLSLEDVLTDAEHCYRLAAGAAAVLDSFTAAQVLDEVLAAFEKDLGVSIRATAVQEPPDQIDIAVANFLWAALGDPRSTIRWQAAHAVRTALELSANDVIEALTSAVVRGDAAGYADERFHFYDMSAAEWFLVAVERVARDDPSAIEALVPAVIELSNRYPDHAMIQRHCFSIGRLVDPQIKCSIGTDWVSILAEPVILSRWDRPSYPKPWMKGAPQSEHRFDFDFDEYVLGKLTETLEITHQRVLDAASDLILDEWGWRADGENLDDQRLTAGVYEGSETRGYKWEIPKTENLAYYLERHAALTIAGRLMRTAIPYCCGSDVEQPDVLEWLANFDIARHDGRWITDQRSLVPGPLATIGPRERNQVHESDFLAALKPADGWVTVWQSASVTEYSRSLDIDIATALVNSDTAGALVRALQTVDDYRSFRIPSADLSDEDFQFSSPPFKLRGWVSTLNSESGIDQLDPFASELTPELLRPSAEIAEKLNITLKDGGLRWESEDGKVFLASETWADISLGRESQGASGNRLRISTDALDQLLSHLDAALIVEVRVNCKDRRELYDVDPVNDNESEGGGADHDKDFRIFTYQPRTGWSDFNGQVGTR